MMMNSWVYEGFEGTFEALGVSFDKLYYESDTYLLGKDIIEQGEKDGIFFRKEDGSVWIDLEERKLDKKLVLRSDGTSVYMTQDIGTAKMRADDYAPDKVIYVVGNEQEYHFKVLFEILKDLKEPYADGLHHLSYGMVNLPDGKMKSREGTVVDADDLIAEVVIEALAQGLDRGELEELSGQTGPYVQYAYVRIKSVLRKNETAAQADMSEYTGLSAVEKHLVQQVYTYPAILEAAAKNYDPAEIAMYLYNLAKSFHKFFYDHSILKAESEAAKAFRLQLSKAVANTC